MRIIDWLKKRYPRVDWHYDRKTKCWIYEGEESELDCVEQDLAKMKRLKLGYLIGSQEVFKNLSNKKEIVKYEK